MSGNGKTRPTIYHGNSTSDIQSAGHNLRTGSLIAFPTETVYGLGANAFLTPSVSSIFTAKGRPADNPLIIHISSLSALYNLNLTLQPIHPYAIALAQAFWPGPLTLVLPLSPTTQLSSLATAGLQTVAIRVPSHPVAHSLLKAAQVPIAAPSANTSGKPSPTTIQHVLDDLDGRIDGIVDQGGVDGGFGVGVESTVVDCTTEEFPVVLRAGAVTADDIFRETGVVVKQGCGSEKGERAVGRPKAPGMKYRHYAPRAQLKLVERGCLKQLVKEYDAPRKNPVGVLADREMCKELKEEFGKGIVTSTCGDAGDVKSVARELYAGLRRFDETSVELILAVKVEKKGVGIAVMERLRKAASGGEVK